MISLQWIMSLEGWHEDRTFYMLAKERQWMWRKRKKEISLGVLLFPIPIDIKQ